MAQNRLLWIAILPIFLAIYSWVNPFGASTNLGPAAESAISRAQLTGPVVDDAGTLTAAQKRALSDKLLKWQDATKHQMVVVVVRTLEEETIKDYTTALANHWGIGRKGYDDGIVLLVAPYQRQVRLAVGQGLETTLPDLLCKGILDERVIPRLRKGDLFGGIDAGVNAVIDRVT